MRKWFLNLPLGKKKKEECGKGCPRPEVVNEEPAPVVLPVVAKEEPPKVDSDASEAVEIDFSAFFSIKINGGSVPSEYDDYKVLPPVVAEKIKVKKLEFLGGSLNYFDFGRQAEDLGRFMSIAPRKLLPPTENQLQSLKELGVAAPAGITIEDAGLIIRRATRQSRSGDPDISLVKLAVGLGVQFSAFASAGKLFSSIINSVEDKDRAALYAYAVSQNIRGVTFGNMLEDPKLEKYYSIADKIVSDPVLLRSLLDRPSDDYKKPHRGTAVYKAVVDHLIEK